MSWILEYIEEQVNTNKIKKFLSFDEEISKKLITYEICEILAGLNTKEIPKKAHKVNLAMLLIDMGVPIKKIAENLSLNARVLQRKKNGIKRLCGGS